MFFRFGSALFLVVLISLAGTALEKRNLELRRFVSRQQYRLEILLEQHASNRVLAQQLGGARTGWSTKLAATPILRRSRSNRQSRTGRGSIGGGKNRKLRRDDSCGLPGTGSLPPVDF